jgi:hypothetical protein
MILVVAKDLPLVVATTAVAKAPVNLPPKLPPKLTELTDVTHSLTCEDWEKGKGKRFVTLLTLIVNFKTPVLNMDAV